MSSEISYDLDSYFERIGYSGSRTATLETLKTLHRLHPKAIPFENLNPLLGLPVKLDLASLQQKLVHAGRGGYCFEHNLLFRRVLEALGFTVKGLEARVMWNRPDDYATARGHMLLQVEAGDASYIADVGFGGLTLTTPLRLEPDLVQHTTHEPYRLIRSAEDYIMQAEIRGKWKSLYRFDLQPQLLPDYQITNWYLSNHPESHFVTGLIAARPVPGKRYALLNNELKIHHLNGETEEKTLTSASELTEVLEQTFQITLPEHSSLNKALEKLWAGENAAL